MTGADTRGLAEGRRRCHLQGATVSPVLIRAATERCGSASLRDERDLKSTTATTRDRVSYRTARRPGGCVTPTRGTSKALLSTLSGMCDPDTFAAPCRANELGLFVPQ